MEIKIYEGFRYQLTKYENYLLSKTLSLKNFIDQKDRDIDNIKNEFQMFYEENKLNLDPNQYVNFLKLVDYSPPSIVYNFAELLNISSMLLDSFVDEFKYCFFNLDTSSLNSYHPLVRMEMITDLYDSMYLDLYNTYLRYLGYLKEYGEENDYSYVYKEKLRYLLQNYNEIYPNLLTEIEKIEKIWNDLFEFRVKLEKEIFNFEFNYYDVLNTIYENEDKFVDLIEFNLLIDKEKYYKTLDKFERELVKVMNLYIMNTKEYKLKKNRFDKIRRNYEIVSNMVKEKIE